MDTLATSFLLGLASAASPCLLPLYPAFLALLATRRGDESRMGTGLLGLTVVLGTITALIAIALVVTAISVSLSAVLAWVVPVSTVILVVLGAMLIVGRNPFMTIAAVRMPIIRCPLAQAYAYGLLFGPVALPCAGPFIVALLAISVGVGESSARALEFVAFGLGFGAPLIVVSLLSATRARSLTMMLARHHVAIGRLAGVLLIATAFAEPARVLVTSQP